MIRTAVIATGLSAILLTSGCDDSVNPILESNRRITMFATLDMNADTQFVRVIPIRGTIIEEFDPTRYWLRSTDLDNGSIVEWEDSLITFDNGATGLVFYTDLRVAPGHSYRVEAAEMDSDVITSAVTNIPPVPHATIGPETVTRTVTPQGFLLIGDQTVQWSNLEREPFSVQRWYRFLRTPVSPFIDLRFPFPPVGEYDNGTITFELDLDEDLFVLRDSVDLPRTAFVGMGMTVTVLNEEFVPPGGVFDPEVLVQPGTFSNVENGFGFIGAVGRFSIEWVLEDANARLLGFLTVRDAFGKIDRDPGEPTVRPERFPLRRPSRFHPSR